MTEFFLQFSFKYKLKMYLLQTNHLNTQLSEARENNDGGGDRLSVTRNSASPVYIMV